MLSGQHNSLGDYTVAVIALREQHRATVKFFLPALRRRRYARHLTVDHLAPMIGVSSNTLGLWETGRHIPPADLFARWRDLLGV
jgi:DNA-binding transcriptional regulator YiaG